MMNMHYGDKQLESYKLYEVKITKKKSRATHSVMKDGDLKSEDSINQELYSVKGKKNHRTDIS